MSVMHSSFFLFGLIVHLILLYSVFDIYYISPIVKNAKSHKISADEGPAKRLVVFSADGLRSRSFFDYPEKSPFLHDLIRNNKAIYGISKSHVPTESRPGHVAIFGGLLEDLSAVTRGWKINPVMFDTVFNQSSRSWLFGSPDIILMFGENDKQTSYYYSANEEQFFGSDAAGLDRWVFDKVKSLFSNNTYGLKESKSIFFLHLLGIDSNGHGHKPYSDNYLNNIRTVDDGVRETVDLFETYFNDGKTAYLFTSDHGMTDYGSHGAAENDEILTPLVLWGSGIKPMPSQQVIINQIDLTSLQSALLNIPIPTNNFGILPIQFLNVSSKYKFQSACANLKQMVEQYGIKRSERFDNSLPFMFRDYPGFKASALKRIEDNVSSLSSQKRYEMAANQCLEWIPNVRQAFIYFHRYNRFTLGVSISSTFILWSLFVYYYVRYQSTMFWKPSKIFSLLMVIELIIGLYQKWPFMHLIYLTLPCYIASMLSNLLNLKAENLIKNALNFYRQLNGQYIACFIGICVLMIGLIASFFLRSVVSFILVFMAPIPYLTSDKNSKWSKIWSICCLLLAVFPICEPVGRTPIPVLPIISPLMASVLLYFYKTRFSRSSAAVFKYLIISNVIISLTIAYSNFYWSTASSTPLIVQLFAWYSITINLMIPLLADLYLIDRIVLWMSAINIPYSIMSIAYESIFYLIFCILLFSYIQLEHKDIGLERLLNLRYSKKKSDLTSFGPFNSTELRRALFILSCIEIAFFCCGNLSSLNSFNPSFIRPFISTFSPFLMATLLVFKVIMPFFILSCVFCLVLYVDRFQSPDRVSILLYILSNMMATIFFYALKDDGSWLEIGISISNYVISMLIAAIFFLLFHISNRIYVIELFSFYKNGRLVESSVLKTQ